MQNVKDKHSNIISWPTSSFYLSPQCLQCYNRP